jgi:hypothetical protein
MDNSNNVSEDLYYTALSFALSIIKITKSNQSNIDVVHTAMMDVDFFLKDYKNAIRRVLNNQKMEVKNLGLECLKFGKSFSTNTDFQCKICNDIFPISEQVLYHLKNGSIKKLNRCWSCHRKLQNEYEKNTRQKDHYFLAKKAERNEIYFQKNKDSVLKKKRDRYKSDPAYREKEKKRTKKYRETHPEWYASIKQKLNERRRGSPPTEKKVA